MCYFKTIKYSLIKTLLLSLCVLLSLNVKSQTIVLGNADDISKKDFTKIEFVKIQSTPILSQQVSDSTGISQVISYDNMDPQISYGLDPESLQLIFPECVVKDENSNYQVDYFKLIPIMLKIIVDQELKIRKLESTKTMPNDIQD